MDITGLFPDYGTDTIPRWGRLFRLPYPPKRYEQFKHKPYDHEEEANEGQSSTSNGLTNGEGENSGSRADKLHLMFRNYIDLGEIPTRPEDFAKADETDEMRILEQPPEPGKNYLAGAERSWWKVAFNERLAEIEAELANPSAKSKDGKEGKGKNKKSSKSKGKPSNDQSGNHSNGDGGGAKEDGESLSRFR